jgi:uncharacterized membrane protein
MKKIAIKRGLLGIPVGIALGYVITIIISFIAGDGAYYPVAPNLLVYFDNEINGVIFQTGFLAVMGFVQAAASTVWDRDDWSLIKQTVVHFFFMVLSMLPIAYLLHWMERSFRGFIIYFSFMVGTYIILWFVIFSFWKYKMDKINKRLNEENQRDIY